jgi:hypothetical protein
MKTDSASTKPQLLMNRRDLMLGVIAFVGGAATLTSCGESTVDALDLHNGKPRFFDADQMRLLARIVDIMIPATDTPGALAAGGDLFIDGLMADWAAADTRNYYVGILHGIDQQARTRFGNGLADCTDDQQQEVMRSIDNSAFGPSPEVAGFRDLKSLILAAYYTSEIGASVELQYELVPGRYLPCAPIEEIGRAWSYS